MCWGGLSYAVKYVGWSWCFKTSCDSVALCVQDHDDEEDEDEGGEYSDMEPADVELSAGMLRQ